VVNVRIPSGSNTIIIMRRTDRHASYQVTHYTALVYPEEIYVKTIQSIVNAKTESELKKIQESLNINLAKDVKTQYIRYQGETLNIGFTTMLVGDGYLWLLDNQTTNIQFEGTFIFDLTNLCIVSNLKG